ncbi:MAG: hypothetical protein ACLUMK_03095 [Christensenellales bacterium]
MRCNETVFGAFSSDRVDSACLHGRGRGEAGSGGIENVMDGLDFDQAADIALDVPGWPEHRSLEETVRALAGGEAFRQTTR